MNIKLDDTPASVSGIPAQTPAFERRCDSTSAVGFKKISTNETVYATGAQRDARTGKGAFHWMPWDAVFLVSRIYEDGNIGRSQNPNKDGNDRNWENGMPISAFVQSAINHLTAYLSGDRSEPHLPQAAWNVINAIQTSIWVYMGWRPAELNTLINQRGPRDLTPVCPLSPKEIEWLKVKGIEKK
jgi:hypothetical protein